MHIEVMKIFRFQLCIPENYVIYPYSEKSDGTPILLSEKELSSYPNIYKYLLSFKNELTARLDSRKHYATGECWYRHLRPGSYNYIRPDKLIAKGIDKTFIVGHLNSNTIFNGANSPCIIFKTSDVYKIDYFYGLLNSKLISYYLTQVCPAKLNNYYRFNANNINEIPIKVINHDSSVEKNLYDKIVVLVGQILDVNSKLIELKSDNDKKNHQQKIDAVDKQIDRLVYELYGLSDDEIRIVEGE